MMLKRTVGCMEKVAMPELGIADIWAKVDTGAYSGALHCTNIRVVESKKTGLRTLKFNPLGRADLAVATNDFLERYVRSATGHRVKRYVIDSTIVIHGRTSPIRIGITDRSSMKYDMLIGRRFLRDNHLVVDVRKNEAYDDERTMS